MRSRNDTIRLIASDLWFAMFQNRDFATMNRNTHTYKRIMSLAETMFDEDKYEFLERHQV